MLVLSRRVGESILIGKDIVIKILKIEKNAVKIGIEAPKEYKVYRKELYERIMKENLQAVKSALEVKGVLGLGEGDGGAPGSSPRARQNRVDGGREEKAQRGSSGNTRLHEDAR